MSKRVIDMDLGALGFFLLAITFVICDTWLFSQGYNSSIHEVKTSEEKRLREVSIREREIAVEIKERGLANANREN